MKFAKLYFPVLQDHAWKCQRCKYKIAYLLGRVGNITMITLTRGGENLGLSNNGEKW